MTLPLERTCALVNTKQFLQALMAPTATPRVPRTVRGLAKALLRHYPTTYDIERAHKALPQVYGPTPGFDSPAAAEQRDPVQDAARYRLLREFYVAVHGWHENPPGWPSGKFMDRAPLISPRMLNGLDAALDALLAAKAGKDTASSAAPASGTEQA